MGNDYTSNENWIRPSAPPPGDPYPSETRDENASGTILIADDDDGLRSALRIALVQDGFAVVEASSGFAAVEYLANAADGLVSVPCMLILDVCMPGFSGVSIVAAMKRIGFEVPTLVITSFPEGSMDAITEVLGETRVVRKPFDLQEMRNAVQKIVVESSVERSMQSPPQA